MGILSWDKPKKAMSTEQWKSISADGAPPGVYVPNMSREDDLKWKAKLTGQRRGSPQVEIRRGGMLIIVNLGGGYVYKYYKIEPDRWGGSTKGVNIHVSMNGPQQMTFEVWDEMVQAVKEAREFLEAL